MAEQCVFFFDFDNTLYSHRTKRVPDSAKAALARLEQQGHRIVLVSGRGNESLPFFKAELGKLPRFVCLLNGQIIYDGGKLVFERSLPGMDAAALFDCARAKNVVYGAYTFQGLVLSGVNDRVRQVWRDFRSEIPRICPGFEKTEPVYQASLYITEAEQADFSGLLGDYITNWSHEFLCNLISKKAGKSQTIRWCLEQFGIGPERAYAFGDGYNDMDMLQAVGHGVAMEDGFAPLKEIAQYIAPPADQDGISRALAHYGFLPAAQGI